MSGSKAPTSSPQNAAWRCENPPSIAQISDGVSQTLGIIESEQHRVNWMCPDAPNLVTFLDTFDSSSPHSGEANASFLDMTITMLPSDRSKAQIRALLTIDAGD